MLQKATIPQNLVISDSHDLAFGQFEAHDMLKALTAETLVKMGDFDDGALLGGQIISLEGGKDNLD